MLADWLDSMVLHSFSNQNNSVIPQFHSSLTKFHTQPYLLPLPCIESSALAFKGIQRDHQDHLEVRLGKTKLMLLTCNLLVRMMLGYMAPTSR